MGCSPLIEYNNNQDKLVHQNILSSKTQFTSKLQLDNVTCLPLQKFEYEMYCTAIAPNKSLISFNCRQSGCWLVNNQ